MNRVFAVTAIAAAAFLAGAPAASASTAPSAALFQASASQGSALEASGPVGALLAAPTAPAVPGVAKPTKPTKPGSPATQQDVSVTINGINGKPSSSLTVILAVTVLSVAPALLLMCTSFTKIIVVLGLTRNALGLQTTPPNQVLVGLALFLSLFIMGPVLSDVNAKGVQPYLHGTKTQATAFHDGVQPLRTFMLDHTRKEELALLTKVAKRDLPAKPSDVPLTTLIPSFLLSELKAAFIIGFVIFIPFLVIDIVVSSVLMAMGMMMLPPVMVSLPFKLLLFVLINGWGLIITALVQSYG